MLIPVYMYSYFYPEKFIEFWLLVEGKFENFEIIIEFIFYSLFFFSILILLICTIISVIYIPINLIYSRKYDRNKNDAISFIQSYNRFIYGAQSRAGFIYRWLLLVMGYLYFINDEILVDLFNQINQAYDSLNTFFQICLYIPGLLYIIFMAIGLYGIFQSLAYRFIFMHYKSDNEQVGA